MKLSPQQARLLLLAALPKDATDNTVVYGSETRTAIALIDKGLLKDCGRPYPGSPGRRVALTEEGKCWVEAATL